MAVPTSPTWQEVLQRIIGTPSERRRLATALGINETTLNRWTKANSHPQRPQLISLVQMAPPHFRAELTEAIERSYPDIHSLACLFRWHNVWLLHREEKSVVSVSTWAVGRLPG